MDAVSYLTNLSRLCDYYTSREMCGNRCPVVDHCNAGNDITEEEAKESVAAVEKWSKENPLVTNGEKVWELIPGDVRSTYSHPANEYLPGTIKGSEYMELLIRKSWWDAEYKGGDRT